MLFAAKKQSFVDSLLQPVAGAAPVGVDLRDEAGLDSIYVRLKDARAQARIAERATEAAGEVPGVRREWQTIRALCREALETQTKDLEVAAWLLEALARLEGFAGLRDGFDVVRGLVERFWPDLHSIDEDDAAGRLSPLGGLNGLGGEGALVQPIRMLALLPGSDYGANALWHWTRVRKNADPTLTRHFNEARTAAGHAAIRERALEATAARDAFAALTATLDRLCGADAPPSSHIRNALDEVIDTYRLLLGGIEPAAAAPAEAPAEPTAPDPVATGMAGEAPAAGPRPITTREDAFAELLRIADFFRHTEPHSPISFSLETLVARGRMNFVDLLEELMPNADHRRQMLQHAGIHLNSEGKASGKSR